MPRILLALLAFGLALGPTGALAAGHCAPYTVTPVPGDPDAFRITTARGTTVARRDRTPVRPAATAQTAVFRVFPGSFDADGDTLGTVHDTIVVAPGTVVRWVRRGLGFHTITNGTDSGDLNAASLFNQVFDDLTTSYERVFTTPGYNDFFCYIHEPVMTGSIFVTSATAGVEPGVIRRARFTRPPSPNPAQGELSFAIALPRAVRVSLAVHDVGGRRVATIEDSPLTAGEHVFRWNARGRDGRPLESGRYFIKFDAGDVHETRAVSLVH